MRQVEFVRQNSIGKGKKEKLIIQDLTPIFVTPIFAPNNQCRYRFRSLANFNRNSCPVYGIYG